MAGEWEEGKHTATASAPLAFDLIYEGREGKKKYSVYLDSELAMSFVE